MDQPFVITLGSPDPTRRSLPGSAAGRHRPFGRRGTPSRGLLFIALLVSLAGVRVEAEAQEVRGTVVDATSGLGIPDVLVRVEGTALMARSGADGTFALDPLEPGEWILLLQHLAYGEHQHPFTVTAGAPAELRLRLSEQAIQLESVSVEATSARVRRERAQGFSLQVVDRDQIEAALGTSRHLGDLIRQTIPGIRLRQANNLVGTQVCLEFRGASNLSMLDTRPCNHPMVFMDGVPVTDPTTLYGMIGLQTLDRIQVVPPNEAGARYGTGALYGVILIETVRPGLDRRRLSPDALIRTSPGRATFDWTDHPTGHPTGRAVLGSAVGTAVGLGLGIAVARQCIGVDDLDQVIADCGTAGNAGAVLAALGIPALAGALGTRWGGRTDESVGRLLPAMLGAGFMLFPGYAFSLSTVGSGSEAANAVGGVFLAVGVPALLTIADRLFRQPR